jgi:CheY-like chemotaxis protein
MSHQFKSVPTTVTILLLLALAALTVANAGDVEFNGSLETELVANAEELLRLAESRLKTTFHPPAFHVLVVDDEPKFRRFLKEALELHGFDIVTAASGPDALEKLKATSVDLILLDLLMPVMDGYQVYHLIREDQRTKDIPILIVTAQGERLDRVLGIEQPTYHYIAKPFQIEELLAKMQALLPPQPVGQASERPR